MKKKNDFDLIVIEEATQEMVADAVESLEKGTVLFLSRHPVIYRFKNGRLTTIIEKGKK